MQSLLQQQFVLLAHSNNIQLQLQLLQHWHALWRCHVINFFESSFPLIEGLSLA
jgi:hypothetical protein